MIKERIDKALVQEPSTDGSGIYFLDRNPLRVVVTASLKAAIVVANPSIGVLALRQLCTSHIAAAKIMAGGLYWLFVSSYFQFSEPMQTHTDALESVLDKIGGPVIVGADVNARVLAWYDPAPDGRGKH
ncbi:Endo/exonuclease/phosphatase domain-containing protein [Aphis craccivora]|uniref:Endo/exonuclease/phosphatase domain-containing protein n=1 Tax=Aphis craccivora TaxID=307492 RepID=A0A6G0Y2L2_APHCR|nr:Endo/exonuclease/phosphatase domain-containing protein [Aphis craccivora]